MKKILLIICITFVAIFNSQIIQSAEPNDITLIALLVVKEDLLKNTVHDEILLIGKYVNGKYEVVSRWDQQQNVEISERKELLRTHDKYVVYQNGKAIKESHVNKVCQAIYDCNAIDIGCSQSKPINISDKNVKGRLEKKYEGFNEGVDFKERTSSFIALNSDSPAIKTQKAPSTINISKSNRLKISKYVKLQLSKNQPDISLQEVEIKQLLPYKLMKDNSIQYIVEAKVQNDKTKLSGIYIVQLIGTNIKELYSVKETNEPDSWGNGYSFLDAIDIDGDGVPELIFEVRGYESTGYQIYHLEKDGYERVFNDITSGC